MAVCGMKCIDLCTDTIKITGVYFTYNNKIKQNEKSFIETIKIQNALETCRMRNATL